MPMEEIIEVEGIPVLIREKGRHPRNIRIKLKKSGVKYLKDRPFSKLSPQHKQALKNVAVMGMDKKKEAAVAAGIPEHNALRTMDSLLVGRRPIVKKIEDKCMAKHKKGADEKVAEVLVDQLDAVHPLAKGEKKDNLAILSAAKEINKINDNYPAKKVDIREMGFHLHFTPDDIEAAKQFKAITQVEVDEAT